MDQGIVARIEDWDARPLSGGYAGLRDLADADFSGAVSAGGAWLFVLNGRVIATIDGTLSAFESADGTAYAAPHPSLPLLFAMQEKGGETEARYYTDDTPLGEVDGTLTEGNFTGYIELSENVLSGDYYVVYYGGRSMSAAFVGSAERLLTGEEAFERAADEVGIYEVRSVELDVQDVPEPAGSGAADEGGAAAGTSSDPAGGDAGPDEAAVDDPAVEETADEPAVDGPKEGPGSSDDEAPIEEAEPAERTGGEADGSGIETSAPEEPEPSTMDEPAGAEPTDPTVGERDAGDADATAASGTSPEEDPFSEEEAWRETRTIPALDPEESAEGEAETATEAAEGGSDRDETSESARPSQATEPDQRRSDGRVSELRRAIEERDSRIEELKQRLEGAIEERDRLRDRVESLEARLEAGDAGAADGPRLDRAEAFSSTDIFVRYGSKGKATMEEAHDGEAEREDVIANLRLEKHTRFDADAATVEGEPFEAFLEDTLEYRFVEWLIEDLIYEIRDTGGRKKLRDLYDVLPRIDRIAFDDTITSRGEDGEERTGTFDVVCRDRMGQPLAVADLNDARDPATGEMMEGLIERTSEIAEDHDTISAAFLVTASFFEPDALEAAAGAAGGGLLDRDSRESFVKLSRKQGYHLCLVEARREAFHIAVPEL